MKYKIWTFTLSALLALQGCGSGAEDWASKDPSAAAVSPNSFNLRTGWLIKSAYGYARQMQASGTCTGEMTLAQVPFADTNDSIHPYKSQALTGVIYYDCTDGSMSSGPVHNTLQTTKYDRDGLDAYFEVNAIYGVWQAAPTFPTAAKVGDSGKIGEIALHDLNSHEVIGKEIWTYTIESDTATTVIFNLTKTSYLAADLEHPTKTERNTYRVRPDDSLYLISVYRVDDTGFVFHAQ
jgi:hypothetical protein